MCGTKLTNPIFTEWKKIENSTLTIFRSSDVISLIPAITCTSSLGVYTDVTVNLYSFYFGRFIGKLTAFFAASGVQITQSNQLYHFRRTTLKVLLPDQVESGTHPYQVSRLQPYVLN